METNLRISIVQAHARSTGFPRNPAATYAGLPIQPHRFPVTITLGFG